VGNAGPFREARRGPSAAILRAATPRPARLPLLSSRKWSLACFVRGIAGARFRDPGAKHGCVDGFERILSRIRASASHGACVVRTTPPPRARIAVEVPQSGSGTTSRHRALGGERRSGRAPRTNRPCKRGVALERPRSAPRRTPSGRARVAAAARPCVGNPGRITDHQVEAASLENFRELSGEIARIFPSHATAGMGPLPERLQRPRRAVRPQRAGFLACVGQGRASDSRNEEAERRLSRHRQPATGLMSTGRGRQ